MTIYTCVESVNEIFAGKKTAQTLEEMFNGKVGIVSVQASRVYTEKLGMLKKNKLKKAGYVCNDVAL